MKILTHQEYATQFNIEVGNHMIDNLGDAVNLILHSESGSRLYSLGADHIDQEHKVYMSTLFDKHGQTTITMSDNRSVTILGIYNKPEEVALSLTNGKITKLHTAYFE